MNLQECLENYIDKNSKYFKERTIYTYKDRANRVLRELGNIDIDTITQDYLQNYVDKQQENGVSINSIKNSITILKIALKPYRRFDKCRYVYSDNDLHEKKVYSEEDLSKIEDFIIASNKLRYAPIIIAINTGMRISEILGLKWEDVNLDIDIISVEKSVWTKNGEVFESSTKTKSGNRKIPITDKLHEYLSKQDHTNKENYVCTNKDHPRNYRSTHRTNELLCKKLGIKSCGLHAYRHNFASRLLKVSTDYKAISQLMGHSSIAITQNVYNHPTDEQKESVIKKAFGEENKKEDEKIKSSHAIDYSEQLANLSEQLNTLTNAVSNFSKSIFWLLTQQKKRKKMSVVDENRAKYKVVDIEGKETYFSSKQDLLEDLDITDYELKKHLQGENTVLDELGVYVDDLRG